MYGSVILVHWRQLATRTIMTKKTAITLLIFLTISLLVLVGFYFVHNFFIAFAPDEIKITKTEITSSDGFVNPITIEKLSVDSFGKEQRPVKYSIEYLTTCSIKQESGKPPVPLKSIKLTEVGRYSWSEKEISIPVIHDDGYSSRSRIDSIQGMIWSMGSKQLETCPLRFEKGCWYFVNFLDPQIVGIYIYIDGSGALKQYPVYSGVSPI